MVACATLVSYKAPTILQQQRGPIQMRTSAGLLVAIAAAILVASSSTECPAVQIGPRIRIREALKELGESSGKVAKQLDSAHQRLGGPVDAAERDALKANVDAARAETAKLQEQVENLRKAVLQDPEAATAISRVQSDVEVLGKTLDRFISLGQWLVGTFVTVLMALFGVVFAALRRIPRADVVGEGARADGPKVQAGTAKGRR